MLAHNIKDILTLVPEAIPMVKKADLEQDFPTNSKDSVSASYLRVQYLTKMASRQVDLETVTKVTKAAELYEVKAVLDGYALRFNNFEKKASENSDTYGMTLKALEAGFEGDLGGLGFLGIEKAASAAASIYEKYGDEVKSPDVLKYAGHGWLNKSAAVISLANRYHATKEPAFVKVARLVNDAIQEYNYEAISGLCKTVQTLDKQAGLDIIGFNFYKEAFYSNEKDMLDSMMVKLAGRDIPWRSIEKFGREKIASTIGKDVSDAMTGRAGEDKAMLESLPLDCQQALVSRLG